MPELSISIDPCNPGLFYACCGVIELFELSGADTRSQFRFDHHYPRTAEFVLASDSELDLGSLVKAIRDSNFSPYARRSADKPPEKDSIAPVSASIFGKKFDLDWWLDEFHDRATSLKCWAGQVTTQKLFSELPKLLGSDSVSFDADGYTSTRFGVDPRAAWVSLDLGYSPNEQGQQSRTYPVVELFAAFGLQGFRPAGDRSKGFRYSLWRSPLPRIVARTASAQPWEGLEAVQYEFQLGGRGSYKFFCFANPISV
jgi:CRISPR-associated protein Csx14